MTLSITAQPWTFALSVDEALRLPNLTATISFKEVTSRILQKLRVLCCHSNKLTDAAFDRPVYTVDIGCPLFDLFFNSPTGYRGAYFQSPGAGVDANVYFLSAITERLVSDPISATSSLSPDFITESLRTPSAKAWLAEHGKEVDRKCFHCKGEWSVSSSGPAELAEIRNGRWESATGVCSAWGRKAPYLTKLRIMGAFLNSRHHELVPHDKRFRAYDINKLGWS